MLEYQLDLKTYLRTLHTEVGYFPTSKFTKISLLFTKFGHCPTYKVKRKITKFENLFQTSNKLFLTLFIVLEIFTLLFKCNFTLLNTKTFLEKVRFTQSKKKKKWSTSASTNPFAQLFASTNLPSAAWADLAKQFTNSSQKWTVIMYK